MSVCRPCGLIQLSSRATTRTSETSSHSEMCWQMEFKAVKTAAAAAGSGSATKYSLGRPEPWVGRNEGWKRGSRSFASPLHPSWSLHVSGEHVCLGNTCVWGTRVSGEHVYLGLSLWDAGWVPNNCPPRKGW